MTLTLTNVTKSYGRQLVLDDVTVAFRPGVTALLGVNGAGKTTLLRIAAGLLAPDSGAVAYSPPDERHNSPGGRQLVVGYAPQNTPTLRTLRVQGFLEYLGLLSGLSSRAARLRAVVCAENVGLGEHLNKRTTSLSGGMVKRLGIAAALLEQPDVLLLDEPTAGLDPLQRRDVLALVRALSAKTAVVLSTHLAEDVTSTADRVVLLDHCELRADVSLDDVRNGTPAAAEAASLLSELGMHLMAGAR